MSNGVRNAAALDSWCNTDTVMTCFKTNNGWGRAAFIQLDKVDF